MDDVAYQLKRTGLICKAFNEGQMSEEMKADYESIDFTNTEDIVEWITENISEVFAEHVPDYEGRKFYQLAAFKATGDTNL